MNEDNQTPAHLRTLDSFADIILVKTSKSEDGYWYASIDLPPDWSYASSPAICECARTEAEAVAKGGYAIKHSAHRGLEPDSHDYRWHYAPYWVAKEQTYVHRELNTTPDPSKPIPPKPDPNSFLPVGDPIVEIDSRRVVVTIEPALDGRGYHAIFEEDRESKFMDEIERIKGFIESGEALICGGVYAFVFEDRGDAGNAKLVERIKAIYKKHSGYKNAFYKGNRS